MPQKILITGGAGFIGHQMIDYILQETDYELVVLDGLTYAGALDRITDLDSYKQHPTRVTFVHHNLRSPINEMVAEKIGPVDYIMHLAANSSVEHTIKHPEESVLDNVLGTVNLLQYARDAKPKKFFYFSTDEVYGPAPEGVNFDEEAPHKPSNPYAAGKAAGEDYAHAFFVTYGVPVVITNTMNVFGFRQHSEKFVPTVIRSVQTGATLPVYANSDKTKAGSRFWIFAYDVADAMLFLIDWGEPGQKYHIVGEERDNLDFAKEIAAVMGKPLNYEMVDFHTSRPGHDLRYGMSGTKLAELGWKHKFGITEAFKKIVASYA